MKLPEMKKFRWNYLAMAFALPTAVMLVMLFITSAEPFGSYTLLYSDMYHQYYPFFREFREALRSGDSILFNWSVGMGMDYLGLISYYLASPLNLLSVLLPESWTLEYFSLLMPIKLGLASGFFALMLKKFYGKDDLSLPMFGAFYGMCAWALGYQWNIMWLDTFALLPLTVLGTVQLLRDKKYVLYTVSLFLSVFANYYVGFFVCIFILLFFFCYELCRFKSVWRFLTDFCRIGVFTILAIGMTAILSLPTLAALQDTYSSVNSFPEGFSTNIVTGETVSAAQEAWRTFKAAKEAGEQTFPLWWDAIKASVPPMLDGMKQVAGQIGGGITLTYVDGLPNLYCGVFAVALGMLFLLAREIKIRDKICCVLLLLFFMSSFIIRQLDYIWHGFHFTNQIPYRFSFLFSFVLLYMAYRAWLVRDQFKIWQIIAAGVLGVALLLVNDASRADAGYMVFNLTFFALYLGLMLYGNPQLRIMVRGETEPLYDEAVDDGQMPAQETEETASQVLPQWMDGEEFPEERVPERDLLPPHQVRRRHAALAIAGVMVFELVLNVVNFTVGFAIADYDYPKRGETAASMFQVMKELEEGNSLFYRAEVTHAQTLNDGALNGYHGISTFTSSANARVTEFMEALGYAGRNNWNRYCWEESSPVANLFLNLKYMIERDITPAPNAYFDVLHSYGPSGGPSVTLMKNNAYLPLGFLAETALADVNFSEANPFTLQNKLFMAATGTQENVWASLPGKDLTVSAEGDVKLTVENISGYSGFESGPAGGKLTYTYTPSQEGFLCLDLTLYAQKNFSVWHNGIKLYSENYSLPTTMAVCNVVPGDVVEVIVECAVSINSAIQIRASLLNEEVFRRGYEVLAASTLELTEFSNTYISGVIDCNRDGLLYTSIPQNGNKRTEQEMGDDGEIIEATTSPEGNWKAYVDGEPVDIILVGNAMVALELSEGVHIVEFRYENKAFEYGSLISLGCAAVFGGIILTDYLLRRRKAKKQLPQE